MSIKIDKSAYEKLIKEDLDFLNKHCPDSLELDHIKLIICSSIDWHYPVIDTDRTTPCPNCQGGGCPVCSGTGYVD